MINTKKLSTFIFLLFTPLFLVGFDQADLDSSTQVSQLSKEILQEYVNCNKIESFCNEQGYVTKIRNDGDLLDVSYEYYDNGNPKKITSKFEGIKGLFRSIELNIREDLNIENGKAKFLFLNIGTDISCNYEFQENEAIKKSMCDSVTTIEQDSESNPRIRKYSETATYNELGKITQSIKKYGSESDITDYVYDENNNLESHTRKTQIGDGTPSNIEKGYYKSNKLERTERTTSSNSQSSTQYSNGTITYTPVKIIEKVTTTYEYDENNNLISRTLGTAQSTEYLENADENVYSYSRLTFYFDEGMTRTGGKYRYYESEEDYLADNESSPYRTIEEKYSHHPTGETAKLLQITYEYDGDVKIKINSTSIYNEKGIRLSNIHDYYRDGIRNSTTNYPSYHENGNEERRIRTTYRESGDIHYVDTLVYDEKYNKISNTIEYYEDGTVVETINLLTQENEEDNTEIEEENN